MAGLGWGYRIVGEKLAADHRSVELMVRVSRVRLWWELLKAIGSGLRIGW